MAANPPLIIVGGGLAGCLAALCLAQRRPDIPLLLLESGASFGGNHTWSFFDSDVPPAARDLIEEDFTLLPSTHRTGGPARYWQVKETGQRLGLISPLTQNFCSSCNRMRVSASGKLYMCLGHEDHVDLLPAMRGDDDGAVDALLDAALGAKPERHEFDLGHAATTRHMSVTGG